MYCYKIPLAFILLLISIQLGCVTAPQPETWVEKRGYIFYPDYSTINILGYETKDSQLRRNTYFSIKSVEKGMLPKVEQINERIFEIKGSVEIENFLKKVTMGNIEGAFALAHIATMTLENPFKEEAAAFIPDRPCDNRKFSVVTKVLNTGAMKVTVKDDNGVNITSRFQPQRTNRNEGELKIKFGDAWSAPL